MNPDIFKAIVPDTPPEILSWRCATGKDLLDEVWEGVYHVVDDKSRPQIDLENELETWLVTHWACQTGGRVFRDTRLARNPDWQNDYRVPSLCLYQPLPESAYVDQILLEPPQVVIEVLSGREDGTQKADFYRELGVSEIWIFDALNGECELTTFGNRRWISTVSNHEKPIVSGATGIEIGCVNDDCSQPADYSPLILDDGICRLNLRFAPNDLRRKAK